MSRSAQTVPKTPEKEYKENDLTRLLDLYPNGKWSYPYLSANPNITWEFIQSTSSRSKIEWNHHWLSMNPNITWEIVKAHPEIGWSYAWLSANPNITWEIVKAHPDPPGGKWDYSRFSENPNITCEIVQSTKNHPDPFGGKWNYSWLSGNHFLHDKNSIRYKQLIEKRRQEVRRMLDPYIIKDINGIIGKYL